MKAASVSRRSRGARRNSPSITVFLVCVPMLAYLLAGCIVPGNIGSGMDTCTQGDNMTDPRLVAGLEEADGSTKLRITWDEGTQQGARLPAAYFQAVALSDPSEVVRSVALSAEREITVDFNDLASYLQTESTLEMTLMFPDRRVFVSCGHAGMDDVYYLKISLQFAADGALEDVKFDQGIRYGPI